MGRGSSSLRGGEGGFSHIRDLATDGNQWIVAVIQPLATPGDRLWAFISTDGAQWTRNPIAEFAEQRGVGLGHMTDGPGGFVFIGFEGPGRTRQPLAWRSPDGITWTPAQMDGLAGLSGETGLQDVVGSDGGYLASGARLDEVPTFWRTSDGSTWTQVDDGSSPPGSHVQGLAVSDNVFVAAGSDVEPFIWTAHR